MNDIEVKKRGWVKNAAIVFLAVMLVLTFFSNTIMNRSLPEVAAQYTQSMTINARIRGSGSVTANELFEVVTRMAHMVSSVHVKTGDYVNTGDVLVTLSQDATDQLAATREELRLAELELERFLIDSPHSNYASLQRAIINAREEVDAAKGRRNSANSALRDAQNALDSAKQDRDASGYDAGKYAQASAAVDAAQADVEIKTTLLEIAQRNVDTWIELNPSVPPAPPSVPTDLADALDDAKEALKDAENILDQRRIDPVYIAQSAAKASYDAANDRVVAANDAVNSAQSSVSSAGREVSNAEQSLSAALEALEEAQRGAGRENSLFEIELREKNRRIDLLKKELEDMEEEGALAEITAAVSGKITQVNITPGYATIPDTALMVIEVVDRGYTLNVPVTAEQASKVRVGDTAEVDRGWWSWNPISAVLTGIKPDPQNPSGGRLLVFSVSGDDVENNTQLNVTINQQSQNYGVVVPNSAIRSDTNGDFVLLVETRSSPLRNRYIATRVDITVIASDDINSAISGGGLSGWDFIITTSNRPIEPGMQVRLADNP